MRGPLKSSCGSLGHRGPLIETFELTRQPNQEMPRLNFQASKFGGCHEKTNRMVALTNHRYAYIKLVKQLI